MKKKNVKKQIVRKFEVNPYQGIAALLVGTKAEGLPLKKIVRNGTKAIAIYE